MDEAWVAKVVQAIALEDLGARLEPHALAELDAVVLGQDLGRHAAERAEHRPAGVDDLELAVALERLWVRGQAGGVPAVVTWELTVEVAWGGVVAVGAEPLGAVGAVELDRRARRGAAGWALHTRARGQ